MEKMVLDLIEMYAAERVKNARLNDDVERLTKETSKDLSPGAPAQAEAMKHQAYLEQRARTYLEQRARARAIVSCWSDAELCAEPRHRILAIKVVRVACDWGLKEAKDFVDEFCESVEL